MGKKQCDISKKAYLKKLDTLTEAKFICKKCSRLAMKKKKLCKPINA